MTKWRVLAFVVYAVALFSLGHVLVEDWGDTFAWWGTIFVVSLYSAALDELRSA